MSLKRQCFGYISKCSAGCSRPNELMNCRYCEQNVEQCRCAPQGQVYPHQPPHQPFASSSSSYASPPAFSSQFSIPSTARASTWSQDNQQAGPSYYYSGSSYPQMYSYTPQYPPPLPPQRSALNEAPTSILNSESATRGGTKRKAPGSGNNTTRKRQKQRQPDENEPALPISAVPGVGPTQQPQPTPSAVQHPGIHRNLTYSSILSTAKEVTTSGASDVWWFTRMVDSGHRPPVLPTDDPPRYKIKPDDKKAPYLACRPCLSKYVLHLLRLAEHNANIFNLETSGQFTSAGMARLKPFAIIYKNITLKSTDET